MRKRVMLTTALCCAMGASLVACVPQIEESTEAQSDVIQTGATSMRDAKSLQDVYDSLDSIHEANMPIVRTLEDGTQVQLTPDVPTSNMHLFDKPSSYNTVYLNADERGCLSCHQEGLSDLVTNGLSYMHPGISLGTQIDLTPMDCMTCHQVGTGYTPKNFEFGSMIHGIHSKDSFEGDCMSCHNATSDGQGVKLWEEVKYDVMQGITFVDAPSFAADITYEQTTTNEMFSFTPLAGEANRNSVDNILKELPQDDETFNNWQISVSGLVDSPFSMSLSELIEQAPSETLISTTQCVMNSPGGDLVSNVEITGIPVSWLLDKAGVQDGATALMAVASDGWERGETLETLETNGAYLVYEINGERLAWEDGYPVRIWYNARGVPSSIRWLSELKVVDTDPSEITTFEGWILDEFNTLDPDDQGKWYNKPNAGILNFHEGQIVKAGEPYEFEGYAQGFDEQIVAVEFSLDNGKTWQRLDTSDSDKTKWVYWHFTYTPEEASSYVLSVRAISESGLVSATPDKVMFNAK